MQQEIMDAVDATIDTLIGQFQREPTRFFTENDLVCCFHRLLHNALDLLKVATAKDKDGLPHYLIHCEYPTPFRCDMKNKAFQQRTDEDRTPRGRGYKRGHYDIVVLNPDFVSHHIYSQIKCQDYSEFLKSVASGLSVAEPLLLYGIELVFRRDEIKPSKGVEWERAAQAFVAEVLQDAAKLNASVAMTGFMKKSAMLAFTKGTTGKVIDSIRSGLQCVPTARLIVV